MMRIVWGVMRAFRPRNLLAAFGLLVLIHVIVDQALLFRLQGVEQEVDKSLPPHEAVDSNSPENAAPLYQYAFWLDKQLDKELGGKFTQIECPQASYYSLALDGLPCGSKDSPPLSREQIELYGEILTAKQPVYDIIAKATALPACMFSSSIAPEFWQSMEISGSQTLREMSRLLLDRARWNARHGDPASAWETARQLLVVINHADEIHSTMNRLTQWGLLQMAMPAFTDIADLGSVPDSVSEAFFAPLRAVSNTKAALATVQFECAYSIQGIDFSCMALSWGSWIRPLATWEKLSHFENYRRLEQALALKTPTERLAAVKKAAVTDDLPDIFLIYGRILETGVALKQYKQHQGAYPQDLEALAKELPDNTTVDPATGKPFEYHLEGSGFMLKSPGLNAFGGANNSGRRYPDIIWQAGN